MGNEVAVSEGIARVARVKKYLEGYQVWIYFAAILIGAVTGLVIPGSPSLEPTINPALAFMLFVTFLPLAFAMRAGVQQQKEAISLAPMTRRDGGAGCATVLLPRRPGPEAYGRRLGRSMSPSRARSRA